MPWEFNCILDELLDGGPAVLNEEEYKMQMNLSLSQIPAQEQTANGNLLVDDVIMN